jgi:hypothetical protein
MANSIWPERNKRCAITTGFWRNAVSNAVLAVLYLIPILTSGVLKRTG